MGVSQSPSELARKLGRLADDCRDLPKLQVLQASQLVKASTSGFINVASGGDMRLSGVGRRGARVGVRYNAASFGGEAKSLVFAQGPLHLVERDTKAGIRPRRRRTGRGKNRFVGPIQGYYHPGTKGKHPWQRGVDVAMPAVTKVLENSTQLVLRRIF